MKLTHIAAISVLAALTFFGSTATSVATPTITNIAATQRTGTKLVDVSYDLASTSASLVKISLRVSNDGGTTFEVPATSLSGAVGAGVVTGTSKVITWNAGVDWNLQSSTQMRFQLTAEEASVSGFSLILGGSYIMGDAVDGDTNAPTHPVSVSTFYMQATETPRSLWNSVRSSASAYGYSDLSAGDSKGSASLEHPVYSVSWYDVVKWCNARSEEDGLTPCYYTSSALTSVYRTGSLNLANDMVKWDANGYRLPTEAEWEKAARGGIAGKRYPWGTNNISYDEANFYSTYANGAFGDQSGGAGYNPTYAVGQQRYTAPVASFAANPFGLYQMAGNVWEWCWDTYSPTYYSISPADDPTGPAPAINRVQRGGGLDTPEWCRVSQRGSWSANSPNINVGFRTLRGGSVINDSATQSVSGAVIVNTNIPLISTQPQPQTVYETHPVTFNVAATGTGTLHYQWRRGTANITGATNSSYTISAASFGDAVSYNVLVTDDVGTTQSDSVTLSVISRAPNASITPGSPVVNPNSPVIFTANVVTGIAPFTYQWRKNGAKITGATASSYSIASAQQSHEGNYDCVVTNTFGSFTASSAALSVNDPVVIVVQPLSQAANGGNEVTLVVTATGTGPFTYQWRRNTTSLPGETVRSLTFTASALTGGNYDCVVTNVVGSVPSLAATVTVLAPPVITQQPVNQLVAAGASALLSINASGDALTYQWRRNGVNLAGKTAALLLIDNVQKANEGSYDVVVKNAYGTVISNAASLQVTSALTITSQPVDVTTSPGNIATFSVTSMGPGVLAYQWYKNGVAITNAKQAALTVTVSDASAAGLYSVMVTSGTLKVTSNPASLRVNDGGLLIYNLAATGATVQGVTSTSVALTGTLILDRTNQRGALIWFGKSGALNTFTTETHEDLRAHSTGPVTKSQTVVSRSVTSGSAPDEDLDLLWLRGTDGLLTIATNDKAIGPQTLAGTLNTMTLSSAMRVEALSLTATLDTAGSATARKTGETVERTLNRLAAYWQFKGYVRK